MKPLLFLLDAEAVHNVFINFGSFLGESEVTKNITSTLFNYKNKKLNQNISGMKFDNPIGLAAGFDYEASLTQILPSVGFGFQAVGTVTNMEYEGNTPPRMARLPKSKALLVNKGFKSSGANNITKRLGNLKFEYPVGVSIGRTNSLKLKTQKQSIEDIISAFKLFEKRKIKNAYYELNISCPNLKGNISFYPPKNLKELLVEFDKLKLKRPVYVKMPITESDKETLAMLKTISKHSPVGVIFGNLRKNRKGSMFDKNEIKKTTKGNFGGRPNYKRSNELIDLTYKHFKDRFIVVGCGGVFSATDAYEKIKRGASLIQLISGMVYEGPQLISEINKGLVELLKNDGYNKISQAVGAYHK